MIEPMALPRVRPDLPSKAAIIETVASGLVVPRLTIVTPMKLKPIVGQKIHQNQEIIYYCL
jgi:hypothetical protein